MSEPSGRLTTSAGFQPERPWLVMSGALDYGTAGAARDFLRAAQLRTAVLVLDLSGVRVIDAAGLGVLVAAARRAENAGGSLVVGRASEAVVDAIRIIGLERMLHVGAVA